MTANQEFEAMRKALMSMGWGDAKAKLEAPLFLKAFKAELTKQVG